MSLNSIPEMEVIIITSSSGWRLRQLWLMSWSLFDVLLFFYVTLPRNLMTCQQPRTKPQMPTPAASPAPKKPRRQNSANCAQAKKTNQPRNRNGLGSLFALGMSLSLLCLKQPRTPNDLNLDADTCSLECWAETAPAPKQRKLRPGDKKPNQPRSRNGLGSTTARLFTHASSSRSNGFSVPPA